VNNLKFDRLMFIFLMKIVTKILVEELSNVHVNKIVTYI
jgi:hypothetical protein